MQQLQGAAEAVRGSQQREQQLHGSLAAAVGQCETVGRELAALSGKLEAKAAQCQELRWGGFVEWAVADCLPCMGLASTSSARVHDTAQQLPIANCWLLRPCRSCMESLSGEKTALTAALTTAQLQLKEATPAGFAAEAAELRRQAEAARQEAAAARATASAAEGRVAEAQRREAEVAGHMREAAHCMEEAQAARAAGLGREQQLAGEIRALRSQLAGKLPTGDPARALQERADQLAAVNGGLQQERAALLGQVQQLQAVGQELSSSCRALEAGMQGAVRERDGLQAALAQAQAAHSAAQQRWEQQRQALESSLSTASGRLAGSEDSAQSSRAQAQALQAQAEGQRREAQEEQQRAAVREHELQTELRLLAAKAEAEGKAARERAEAGAAALAAEAARQQEQLWAQDAELAAARREAALLAAEQQRLQVGGRW